MKNRTIPRHSRFIGLAVLCLAAISTVHAEAPATSPKLTGSPKVRILVRENSVATTPGGAAAATPAASGGAKGQGAQQNPTQAAASALDAEKFTRTAKKTLTVELVNLTAASMDVTAKTTFLARDEGGKHDVVEEKTVENKVTLQPGRGEQFTTEEVSFTHTTAHRAPAKKGGGGTGGGMGRNAVSSMVPASGHSYCGYKVEVFQGSDLVGTAANEAHF